MISSLSPSLARFFGDLFAHPNLTGYLWLARIDRSALDNAQNVKSMQQSAFSQKAIKWPEEQHRIAPNFAAWQSLDYDVYFCPQLTETKSSRTKANIKYATALWADLDTCELQHLLVLPTIVWQTSPGRHQALWLLERPVPALQAEAVSKAIALHHAAQGCDKSGYDLSQLLRVPGTLNFKYEAKPEIKIVYHGKRLFRLSDFAVYPISSIDTNDILNTNILNTNILNDTDDAANIADFDVPGIVWSIIERAEPYLDTPRPGEYDRSGMIYNLINVCREQGLTNVQTHLVLSEFQPYIGKIRDYGLSWARRAIPKMFEKINENHPHEGFACRDVDCAKIPEGEVVRYILPMGFGVH